MMEYSDDDVYEMVADHVVEGGWSSMMNLTGDEKEASSLVECGYGSLYAHVSSMDVSMLREKYSFLFENEDENEDEDEDE